MAREQSEQINQHEQYTEEQCHGGLVQWRKKKLTNFIFKQPEFCLRLLPDALDFWDKLTYRCIMAFKSNTNNVSPSSPAEVALASIKAGQEKNVSLFDAAYCDIVESTRFEKNGKIE